MSDSKDVDSRFGFSLPAPSVASAKPSAGAEGRKEIRVHVKWEARALLPGGQVVALRLRDISESGVGLVSDHPITAHGTIRVAIAVPDINDPGQFTTVTGSVRTAHVTVSGPDLVYGGVWLVIDGDGTELVRKWVRKLRS